MIRLEKTLVRLATDLKELRLSWAMIGGIAVSLRAEPRTTRDLDVAIAVGSDREAERIVADFTARGYGIEAILEQEATGRLATVRLLAPSDEPGEIVADLLFSSSGVEPEVVAAAEILEALPGIEIRVARTADLLALKVLAGRPKDLADIESLDKDPCSLLLTSWSATGREPQVGTTERAPEGRRSHRGDRGRGQGGSW